MVSIRLDDEINARLERLAKRTNRTKTDYIREAIVTHLEDLEDYYAAQAALEQHHASGGKTITLEELGKKLGLGG